MALNPHFLLATRNSMLDLITSQLGTSAVMNLYAGVQPADTSAAVTAANVIVATPTFPSTNAFASATAGVITANTITSDSSAVGGSANWFALCASTGLRVVDGSIGTSASDLNLNSQAITTGAAVAITSFTITMAA